MEVFGALFSPGSPWEIQSCGWGLQCRHSRNAGKKLQSGRNEDGCSPDGALRLGWGIEVAEGTEVSEQRDERTFCVPADALFRVHIGDTRVGRSNVVRLR
jgi:hypothetical protein